MSMSGRSGVVLSVPPPGEEIRSESGEDGERPSGRADGIEGRPLDGGGEEAGPRLSGDDVEAGAIGEEAGGPGRGIGGLGRGGSAMPRDDSR